MTRRKELSSSHQKIETLPSYGFSRHLGHTRSSHSSIERFGVPKGSAISIIDPGTSCEVVLVGCFHGSQSSAADVQEALSSSKKTDVVVLELCASRFADLRRQMESTSAAASEKVKKEGLDNSPSFFSQWMKLVLDTSERRGWLTGGVTAVLSGFTGIQTMLSGLEPGLEFTTSVECAKAQEADIILADQNVDETLEKIGKLPFVSFQLFLDFLTNGWGGSYGPEAKALFSAVIGNSQLPESVNLFGFLTRSEEAVKDLVRLIVPPFLLLQSFILISNALMGSLVSTPEEVGEATVLGDEARLLLWVFANAVSLAVSFVLIAVPAARVVLRERDEFLAKGVRAACREAGPNGRVVAVLGLLHVNGVANRILEPESEEAGIVI